MGGKILVINSLSSYSQEDVEKDDRGGVGRETPLHRGRKEPLYSHEYCSKKVMGREKKKITQKGIWSRQTRGSERAISLNRRGKGAREIEGPVWTNGGETLGRGAPQKGNPCYPGFVRVAHIEG